VLRGSQVETLIALSFAVFASISVVEGVNSVSDCT